MTVLDLIKGSMRLIGAIDPGETPATSEAADALSALNAMLDSWSLERLIVYNVAHASQNVVAYTQEYTAGIGGTWNMAVRPAKVEKITCEDVIIPFSQNLTTPLITVRLDDEPTTSYAVEVYTWTPLTAFTGLTDVLALPAGYERALRYNLAAEICAEYPNCPLSNVGAAIAIQSKANIKRANAPKVIMSCDAAMLSSQPCDIYSGN